MYTEQQIRGLAINFLRQHYKLRPRSGTSGTRVVHRPHYYEGVTIDARLAYQKPDLSWFTATVEASGVDQANEVLYRVNYFRIGAHALVISLSVLALFLAGTQVQKLNLWELYGRPGVYVLLLNTFLVIWATTAVLLSRLRYYRYIYAIAQFMRFHADAQWIAYDQHIFSSLGANRRSNRFYRELQRQCLRFGFGLMEIQADNKVRWLIEPSHVDQFGGQRSRLPLWVAAAAKPPQLLQTLRKRLPLGTAPAPAAAPPVPTDGQTDPLSVENYTPMMAPGVDYTATIVPAKKGRLPWYRQPVRLGKHLRWRLRNAVRSTFPAEIRKRPGYYELPWWLLLVGVAALLVIGGVSWLQAEWTPERRPGQVAAAPDLHPLEPASSPELADASPEPLEGEYDHTLSANEVNELENFNLSPEQTERPVVEPVRPAPNTVQYYRYAPGGTVESSYGCGPLGRSDTTTFVLLEGRYPVFETARQRAEAINQQAQIATAVLLADCLSKGAAGYLLYLGEPVATEAEANLLVRRFTAETGGEISILPLE